MNAHQRRKYRRTRQVVKGGTATETDLSSRQWQMDAPIDVSEPISRSALTFADEHLKALSSGGRISIRHTNPGPFFTGPVTFGPDGKAVPLNGVYHTTLGAALHQQSIAEMMMRWMDNVNAGEKVEEISTSGELIDNMRREGYENSAREIEERFGRETPIKPLHLDTESQPDVITLSVTYEATKK